jgi:hypothetical protein
MDIVDSDEDFIVNIMGVPRLLLKMPDNEEEIADIRLFDSISAIVYFDNEDKFIIAIDKLLKTK